MNTRAFAPIADTLRREVIRFYRDSGEDLDDPEGATTLEDHSGHAESRAQLLLGTLYRETELESVSGLRVLDLGCGFGALAIYMATQGAEVVGVDSDGDRLSVGSAVAAAHELPAEFREGRMQALAVPPGSFDLAVLNNSLPYVVPRPERRAALAATLRALRPGGFVVIRSANRWNPRDQFTGLPLIQLFPPRRADQLARRLGRRRSSVRLTSSLEGARELRMAGFKAVRHVSPPGSGWHAPIKAFARFQHFIARRPS